MTNVENIENIENADTTVNDYSHKGGPSQVSKREYWTTLLSITILLVFIAIIVSISLYRSGPPARETIIFPHSTYVCTSQYNSNGDLERICAYVGGGPLGTVIPPDTQSTTTLTPEENR